VKGIYTGLGGQRRDVTAKRARKKKQRAPDQRLRSQPALSSSTYLPVARERANETALFPFSRQAREEGGEEAGI